MQEALLHARHIYIYMYIFMNIYRHSLILYIHWMQSCNAFVLYHEQIDWTRSLHEARCIVHRFGLNRVVGFPWYQPAASVGRRLISTGFEASGKISASIAK